MPTIDMIAVAYPAFSIKLIGLFVTALVGLYTIEDLWEKFGDLRMSVVCPVFTTISFDPRSHCLSSEHNCGTGAHEWDVSSSYPSSSTWPPSSSTS